MTPSTVVVAMDGSKFSERAVPVAAWLAGRLSASVLLVSAIETEDERRSREEYLAVVAERGFHDAVVGWSVVVDRDPAGLVHETLRRLGEAVACLATHGRGHSAALIGSVATEVVARGHDPLVLVGPLIADALGGVGVVACVDERPSAVDLVRLAAGWGRSLAEPVVAVVVAEPVPPPVREDKPVHRLFGPDGDVVEYLDQVLTAAAESLPADADLRGDVMWDPIGPSDGVVSYVEDRPAAMVVVGSRIHEPLGLGRAVFGHASAAIIHSCPAPVLVAPPGTPGPSGYRGS